MSAAHNTELHPDEDIKMGALSGRLQKIAWPVGILALAATVILGATHGDHFHRFYYSVLIGLCYCLSVAVGALFFVIIQPLTRSQWSPVVRRIAEILTTTFWPVAALLAACIIIPMLAGSAGPYHHWVHPAPDDHILHNKHAWLNVPFFAARIGFYFAVWIGMSRYFFKKSREQDQSGDPAISERLRVASGPAIIVFALTVCFGAFDLLMSLDPHWFSTMFGVYYFAGSAVAIFSTLALIGMYLQRSGKLARSITTEHYHDIGKLMFAFVFFWSYVAFSQFMLIWYANLPEETVWFQPRMFTSWSSVSYLLLFGHFVFPFLFLLSRWTKRLRAPLAFFAVWLMFIHYVDIFWLAMPEHTPEGASFHLMDLTAVVGVAFVCIGWAARAAAKVNLIPVKDPKLAISLGFENY
ncbi:hypothetical protein [Haliangium sp.]|uniref:hypothetical protein n=1 Tax=Haliangium sp. TaxID=2663208 RepID=UPI003D09CC9B